MYKPTPNLGLNIKKQLRDSGTAYGPVVLKQPEPVPPAVSPGLIPRLSGLAAHFKTHKNYIPAIGQDLWLIGSTQIGCGATLVASG
jgi:hypothetical protein